MALENLISMEVTAKEAAELDKALQTLEAFTKLKLKNLTPAQRKQYGRIGEERVNWLNKTNGYMEQNPETIPAFIDKEENKKDFVANATLRPLLNRLASVHTAFDDTVLIMGNDLYYNALTYYKNIKLLAENNVANAGAIYDALKVEFESKSSSDNNTIKKS